MASPTDLRPPFTLETATQKVRAAEDAWNSRDPNRVSLAYSEDSIWRNRSVFVTGRRREASINDVAIIEGDRNFFWDASGPRPLDHVGITDVK